MSVWVAMPRVMAGVSLGEEKQAWETPLAATRVGRLCRRANRESIVKFFGFSF